MPMPLNDFEIEGRDHFEQRPGKLAQSPAHRRNHTSLTNLTSKSKASRFPRGADLLPKAARLPRKKNAAVEVLAGHAQILDLSDYEGTLTRIRCGVERRNRFREKKGEIRRVTCRQGRQTGTKVRNRTSRLVKPRFCKEQTNCEQARVICHWPGFTFLF